MKNNNNKFNNSNNNSSSKNNKPLKKNFYQWINKIHKNKTPNIFQVTK